MTAHPCQAHTWDLTACLQCFEPHIASPSLISQCFTFHSTPFSMHAAQQGRGKNKRHETTDSPAKHKAQKKETSGKRRIWMTSVCVMSVSAYPSLINKTAMCKCMVLLFHHDISLRLSWWIVLLFEKVSNSAHWSWFCKHLCEDDIPVTPPL